VCWGCSSRFAFTLKKIQIKAKRDVQQERESAKSVTEKNNRRDGCANGLKSLKKLNDQRNINLNIPLNSLIKINSFCPI
jgi:uncharacterized FlaG/YvyC family protein